MSLKIITNDVWRDCAELRVCDSTLVKVSASEYANAQNVVGSRRDLEWTQSGTTARIFDYINKTGNLAASCFIATRADRYTGHGVYLASYSAYSGTVSTIFDQAAFSQTLIGPRSTDWVYEFTLRSGQQAFEFDAYNGTAGAYTKTIGKLYFGTSFTLSYVPQFSWRPVWETVQVGYQVYHLQDRAEFVATHLTAAQVSTLENLYKQREEPIFLYDSAQSTLIDGLWHCLLLEFNKVQTFNDTYAVQLSVGRLRHYA